MTTAAWFSVWQKRRPSYDAINGLALEGLYALVGCGWLEWLFKVKIRSGYVGKQEESGGEEVNR